ncbi:MAG: hypothetical protein BMS9Abin26_1532 [Gammaproteobacteria bacterium]|nr:MAG: hypothetical protein BMS9Abin26_1532 [Gammaproteobacteria bacterium]
MILRNEFNIPPAIFNVDIHAYAMDYARFIPRLYNLCQSFDLKARRIRLASAFCMDEDQSYCQLLLAKHFGRFPADLSFIDGTLDREAFNEFSTHAGDMIIIQASHIGYNPLKSAFCTFPDPTSDIVAGEISCHSLCTAIEWCQQEYNFAQQQIQLERSNGNTMIIIDNGLLNNDRQHGLFLNLENLVAREEGLKENEFLETRSTAKVFRASRRLAEQMTQTQMPIGHLLSPGDFYFRFPDIERKTGNAIENLSEYMPLIVTSEEPGLMAAQINTMVEFDRNSRYIKKRDNFRGRRIVYLAGLNVDIQSSKPVQFQQTRFIPWAAYIRVGEGVHSTLEQAALTNKLFSQSHNNPDQLDLDRVATST